MDGNLLTSSDEKRIYLLQQNLTEILKTFEKCKIISKKFMKVCPSWMENRKNIIRELDDIAENLDATKLVCNVVKMVGSSVGVAGGILGIVGAALIPFTMGISTPLMITGIASSALGGTSNMGTAITEMVLLKNKVEAAQKLLEEDKEKFKSIDEWFRHAASYMETVEEFLGLDIFIKMKDDAQKLLSLFTDILLDEKKDCLSKERVFLVLKNICPSLCDFSPLISIILLIANTPNLLKLFEKLIHLHHDNPVIFEAVSLTTNMSIQLLKGVDMGTDFLTAVTSGVKVGTVTVGSTMGKAISHGIFAGLGLAVDVTSLVLTSVDVYEGSKCSNAQNIRVVNEKLKEELVVIENLYSELRNYT